MNIRSRHPRPLAALIALTAALAACRGTGERDTTAGGMRAGDAASAAAGTSKMMTGTRPSGTKTSASHRVPTPLTYDPTHPDTTTPPVYYDLTRFDWYRRGQPLIADDHRYSPEGPLVSLPRDSLTLAGRYQGVAYYRAGHGGADTVYVPVYHHYWLAFVHRGERRAR